MCAQTRELPIFASIFLPSGLFKSSPLAPLSWPLAIVQYAQVTPEAEKEGKEGQEALRRGRRWRKLQPRQGTEIGRTFLAARRSLFASFSFPANPDLPLGQPYPSPSTWSSCITWCSPRLLPFRSNSPSAGENRYMASSAVGSSSLVFSSRGAGGMGAELCSKFQHGWHDRSRRLTHVHFWQGFAATAQVQASVTTSFQRADSQQHSSLALSALVPKFTDATKSWTAFLEHAWSLHAEPSQNWEEGTEKGLELRSCVLNMVHGVWENWDAA